MPGFDMHIHTKASDGTFDIQEIIRLAQEVNLDGIAITDHDTVEGLDRAVEVGQKLNFPIIPGIELSTDYQNTEIHILGYFIDFHLPWFRKKMNQLQKARIDRIIKMVDKLTELGYDITGSEVFALAGAGSVGRPHLAYLLYKKGQVASVQEAFQKLIGRGCPAHIPRFKLEPTEAVQMIKKAGGIPVLAHPGLSKADHLIQSLCHAGLLGIEVYHPDHKLSDESRYLKLAQRYGLIITGGSDFHGIPDGKRSILGSKYVGSAIWDELLLLKEEQNSAPSL
ncbi:PHP domain-containing protein [Dehalobacterium formicoaceticum]|uniref:PHP domain-containing protein n=1 Tax=Dehalobacterium formicoaceticum TaxID=51515 RepID=A0ABT1Y4X0_9FIRM|nr:PHP domain-containing protein [Dehalobacterium formicoaceticum]MCR6545928.1 PHP domain-containing protein [Dehalobacterium formicoaceticum]